MDNRRLNFGTTHFKNPFNRPWMHENGAAAVASGNTGLKGIIAGKVFITKIA